MLGPRLLRCLIPKLKCAAAELCGSFRHSLLSSNSATTTKYFMENWLKHAKTLIWSFFIDALWSDALEFSLCLGRKLHPHKHIWCHFEARYAHPEKVSLVPTFITDLNWIFAFLNNFCSPPRKVNSFLNKMNPTEVQMAAYIDTMRDKQWPEFQPAAPPPPRTDEEKNETRERAHSLISARCRRHLSALKEVTRYFWLLIIYKQNIIFSL